MSRVVLEVSISLDGYVTGPDVSDEEPLGRGGEALHEWMFAGRSPAESRKWQTEHFSAIGAVIMGRRMVDLGIRFWGEEPVFGAPCFVVTHRAAETIVKRGGTSYVFVTGGLTEALRRARQAAGSDDVLVNGGAQIDRQFLRAGMVDELRLHLVPVALGGGARLFDGACSDLGLVPTAAVATALVTHLTYEVERSATGER
jgi:dihydrofolate reductase